MEESKKNAVSAFTIGKYIVTAAIAAFIVLMILSGRSSRDVPFETVKSAVQSVIMTDTLQEADRSDFRRYYNLNDADYDGILLYQPLSGMSAEEVLLVKVKDTSQIEDVKAAIEARIESRKNDFAGYAPDEEELMDHATVTVKGKYIFYVVSEQADIYNKTFQESA